MPEESGRRLTVSVGRREFENLQGAWAAYLDVTQTARPVDPVLAMRQTGSLLRSLERLAGTVISDQNVPGVDNDAGRRG
ncbi:hypothetical protein [Arthrobacter sp. R4-81]